MEQDVLINMLKPFPVCGVRAALIDHLKVTFWIEGHYNSTLAPIVDVMSARSTDELGICGSSVVKHFAGGEDGPNIRWKNERGSFRQRLGARPMRGRKTGKISQTVEVNGLRLVNEQLTAGERRIHAVPKSRKDNFVHPRAVPSVDLQDRVVRSVAAALDEARADYLQVLEKVFGKKFPKELVRTSVTEIEIAWDVACEAPVTLLHAYESPWLRQLPKGRRQHLWEGRSRKKDVRIAVRSSEGYLAASFGKPLRLKLYLLPESTVRFEGTLTKKGVKSTGIGEWNLFDPEDLRRGLQHCAKRVYRYLREVQEEVAWEGDASILDLAVVLSPGPRGTVLREIINQLCTTGKVHATDESIRRVLRALGDAGVVAKADRGYWRVTQKWAGLFRIVRRNVLAHTA